MACPSCSSDDWRLASLVHKEGLSTIKTRTQGSGLSLSQGGGLGFGSAQATTRGTQQTALSQAAAPPSGYILTTLLSITALIALVVGLFSGLNGWLAWLIAAGAGFGVYRIFPGENAAYKTKLADYKITRMCQRCGNLYIPAGTKLSSAA